MDYKQRLGEWNSTNKYKLEMHFLYSLMQPKRNERILDYGCGIGTMCKFLLTNTEAKIYGHDQRNYLLNPPIWFLENIYFPVDKMYMMHSIAHIVNIDNV